MSLKLLQRIFGTGKRIDRSLYRNQYLTMTNMHSSTNTFTITIGASVSTTYVPSISYSRNNGVTWTKTDNINNQEVIITISDVPVNGKVLLKGPIRATRNTRTNEAPYMTIISATAYFSISGNLMSLFYGDNFYNKIAFPTNDTGRAAGLFWHSTTIRDASNLILPVTNTVANGNIANAATYERMFDNCSNLLYPPADIAARYVGPLDFSYTFSMCTSMLSFPTLHIVTLSTNIGSVCMCMFYHCINAVNNVPTSLPNNGRLGFRAYYGMFQNCRKITTVPRLNVTQTNGSQVMANMFNGCLALTDASNITINYSPASANQKMCESMFQDCTNLVHGPTINRATLNVEEFKNMFSGCTKLEDVHIYFNNISASNCINNWLYNVNSTGTIYHHGSATLPTGSASGVPSGWTVVNV